MPDTNKSYSTEKRVVTTLNVAQHDEIIISNTEWNQLCNSIKNIEIKKNWDVPNILLGCILATMIEYGRTVWISGKEVSPVAVVISIILYIICKFLIDKCDYSNLGPTKESENSIHLEYAKMAIKTIEERKSSGNMSKNCIKN